MRIFTLLPAICAASLLLAPTADAEKVRRLPIVDKAIEHHGGDLYRSTETKMTVSSRSGSFTVISSVVGDDFDHRVSGKNRDGAERRVRQTNSTVEQWLDGKPVDLDDEGQRRAISFVEARVYFPFLPFRLNDPSAWKEDQGLEEWYGRTLHRVKVTFDAGTSNSAHDQYTFWFEPETGKLAQYAYSFGTGRERGGLRFRPLQNYRRVGGILFADVANLGVNGSGELRVDLINPAYVKEEMEEISKVTLSGIEVQVLK